MSYRLQHLKKAKAQKIIQRETAEKKHQERDEIMRNDINSMTDLIDKIEMGEG